MTMRVVRLDADTPALVDPLSAAWSGVRPEHLSLVPTPLAGNPGIEHVSPFLAKSTDHGAVDALEVAAAHNGEVLALRLVWASERHDEVVDLDEFSDGAAVLFAIGARASAVTMGGKGQPVNAWFWRADHPQAPHDVVAEGYGTSVRTPGDETGLRSAASWAHGRWQVVLARDLGAPRGRAVLRPGRPVRVAFAVWDGGNRERSGRKAFSGEFVPAELPA